MKMEWMIVNEEHRAQLANTQKGMFQLHRDPDGTWPLRFWKRSAGPEVIGTYPSENEARKAALEHLEKV